LLLESQSPGLNANSQIKRARFLGKGNKIYYSSSEEEEDKESQPLKVLLFTSERKCPLFKGEFRGLL
jgi:hypothetical protein